MMSANWQCTLTDIVSSPQTMSDYFLGIVFTYLGSSRDIFISVLNNLFIDVSY